jgi:hypothetical protein
MTTATQTVCIFDDSETTSRGGVLYFVVDGDYSRYHGKRFNYSLTTPMNFELIDFIINEQCEYIHEMLNDFPVEVIRNNPTAIVINISLVG